MRHTSKASAGPVLLLTRPRAQSEEFLAICEARLGRGVSSVVSPLMRMVPTGEVPGAAETLVVTSGNAVRILGDDLKGQRVATVGDATASLARSFGADAECLGNTAEAFLGKIGTLTPPVVVARGVHARMDLAAALTERGIEARSVTVYDQVSEPISDAAKTLLQGDTPIIAPVFSPRSAALLSASTITAPMQVLALSPAVAEAWTGPGTIRTATDPTAKAMCDLVAEAL